MLSAHSFSYVNDLSVKKQDKALINARRAHNIRTVLTDPKDTAIGSAQFRYASLYLSPKDYLFDFPYEADG